MTMTAWTGLPGAGKSYGVVQNVIAPALKTGRVVVTNIPLDKQAIEEHAPNGKLIQLDKKCAVDHWMDSPAGSVIVIDEAWHWWPSGMTADTIPQRQKAFFAEHRHKVGTDGFANEIYLVGQDLANIASFVRSLCEQTFRVEKLTAVGSTKRFRVDVYNGAVTGQRPPKAQLLRQMFGKYDPAIFKLYQSHTQSKTGIAGLEEKPDKRGTVFGSFTVKAAIVALCLLPFALWAIVAALGSFKDSVTGGAAKRSAAAPPVTEPFTPKTFTPLPAAPQTALQAPIAPETTKDTGPKLSGRWRIVGTIERADGTGVALLVSATAQRRIILSDCDRGTIDLDLRCNIDSELVTYYSGDTGGFASAAIAKGTLSQ